MFNDFTATDKNIFQEDLLLNDLEVTLVLQRVELEKNGTDTSLIDSSIKTLRNILAMRVVRDLSYHNQERIDYSQEV